MRLRHLVKTAATSSASVVVAVLIFGPAGDFIYDWYKARGYFNDPNATVATVIAFFVTVAASQWFHWFGGAAGGFACGVWLDTRLRRAEQASAPRTISIEVSREELATKAADLAAKLLILGGQHAGRLEAARMADARAIPNDGSRSAEAEGHLLQSYGELYAKDVSSVVHTSMKVISINRDYYWRGFHNFRSGRDIPELARYMAKLSTELLHPVPDLPMHSPLMEQHKRLLKSLPDASLADPVPPSPPAGTSQRTSP